MLKFIPGAGSIAGGAINATIAFGTTKVMAMPISPTLIAMSII
ncbi:hypothetical protein [Helicobacter canis]|nr:hypothetical protein [Helicobacter canis]